MGRVNMVAVGAQGSLAPSDRSGDQGRCLSLGPLACQVFHRERSAGFRVAKQVQVRRAVP
jgi:hypothetical protein